MLWRGFITHVVSADQGAYSLQRAEGVILAVRLAVAGIPDQVVVLLVSQDIRCGSLRRRRPQTSAFLHKDVLKIAISAAYLWDSTADYKPGFLFHKQEVVAQKYSMFFFISSEEGEELLQIK